MFINGLQVTQDNNVLYFILFLTASGLVAAPGIFVAAQGFSLLVECGLRSCGGRAPENVGPTVVVVHGLQSAWAL